MRLFTAIELPPGILQRVERLLSALRPTAPVQWSPSQNLHITTKFIGEWPEARLSELEDVLKTLTERTPFPVLLQGLGWFPDAHKPRVLYLSIERHDAMTGLARDTNIALASIGIPPEQKRYSPHLTLARIREKSTLDALRAAAAKETASGFEPFQADRFWLYRSELTPRGSIYTKLASFPFRP
jgi:2'-5' RNA ligase